MSGCLQLQGKRLYFCNYLKQLCKTKVVHNFGNVQNSKELERVTVKS